MEGGKQRNLMTDFEAGRSSVHGLRPPNGDVRSGPRDLNSCHASVDTCSHTVNTPLDILFTWTRYYRSVGLILRKTEVLINWSVSQNDTKVGSYVTGDQKTTRYN